MHLHPHNAQLAAGKIECMSALCDATLAHLQMCHRGGHMVVCSLQGLAQNQDNGKLTRVKFDINACSSKRSSMPTWTSVQHLCKCI